MGRRIRAKAKDPQVAAAEKRAREFKSVGLSADSASLPSTVDLVVEPAERGTAGKRGHEDRARRMDAFEALKDSLEPSHYAAARELEKAIVTMMGEHDRGRSLERVDCDEGGNRTDAMLAARDQVHDSLRRIGDRDAWLLSELIYPGTACKLTALSWRDVVFYVTGETHTHAQAAAVRSACANLARATTRKNTTSCVAA